MADVGLPFYPPAHPGTVVYWWKLRLPGQMTRTVTVGRVPAGWWVAANWQLGGVLYASEAAAVAQGVRLREAWPAHPGEWVCEERAVSDPAVTVAG